jgi:restriction system protein
MPPDETIIWGIHAGRTGNADTLFLQKGYIALGWNKIGDLRNLEPNRDAFKDVVAEVFPAFKPGAIPVAAGQLFRFANVLSPGDMVVYRSKTNGKIHIGEITGEYDYRPDIEPGYPHVRSTKWLKSVDPKSATQGALYEIGSAMSLFQVKNYADEWLSFLVSGTKVVKPVETRDVDEDPTVAYVAESIQENTRDFIRKQFETELKGHPFARFVGHLLNTMGYKTRVSPEGADGGVDIIAHRDELGFEPPIIKVQVKSGAGNVGHPEVASLLGTLDSGEFGLVVTLSSFTPPAKAFARNKGNLRLINGEDLIDLTLQHYDRLDSRYRAIIPLKRVYVPEPVED